MLSVVHFLRSLFKSPEPGAYLPSEIGGNQYPSSPAEPEELEWSQDTDHKDFETLSHQSESRSDTKTDLFESASDTGSLPSDLTGEGCLPPGGPSTDRETSCGCPDDSATGPSQGQHSTCILGRDVKEKLCLSPGFEEEPWEKDLHTLAAGSRDKGDEPILNCVASLEQRAVLAGCSLQNAADSSSLQTAQKVTVLDLMRFSVASLQKFRSESHLDASVAWPFFLHNCELGQSWPCTQSRPRASISPHAGQLDNTDPQETGTKMESTAVPAVDTHWAQPCLGAIFQPSLATSCLFHARHHLSTPENIGDNSREAGGCHYQHMRTLARAHSIPEFMLGHPEASSGQSYVKPRSPLWGRTETDRDSRSQSTHPSSPTQLSHLLCTSQSQAPHLQDQHMSSGQSLQRAIQDTPCAGLPQENQLEQYSRPDPALQYLTPDVVKFGSPEAVPGQAGYKLEHSPAHRPRGSYSACPAPSPADVSSKQEHLQNTEIEAGNQVRNHSLACLLREESKLPIRAGFLDQCSCGGTQAWSRDGMGCWEVSDSSDAPVTTPKLSEVDTSKEDGKVTVVDPTCKKNALQEVSESPEARLTYYTPGDKDSELGSGSRPRSFTAGLPQEPRAGSASRGRCTLIIVAMEQKGQQATTGRTHPLLESQLSQVPREKSPQSVLVAPCESPKTWKTQADECGPPAAPPWEAIDHNGTGQLVTLGTDLQGVLASRAAQEGMLSAWHSGKEKLSQESLGSGRWKQELLGVQVGTSPEGCGIRATERDLGVCVFQGQDPEKHLAFLKVTSFPRGRTTPSTLTQALTGGSRPQGSAAAEKSGGQTPTATKEWQGPAPSCGDRGEPPETGLQHQGYRGVPGHVGSRSAFAESCSKRRLKATEKKLRARLAFAQKTFTTLFESKVEVKENAEGGAPGTLNKKEQSRPPQRSWLAFLKSKDMEGPKRPPSVRQPPGIEIQDHLTAGPLGTSSHSEECFTHTQSCVHGGHWAPPHTPAPLSSSTLASPEHRRKSEPTIKLTDPQEGVFPGNPWLKALVSPGAQPAALACGSACCLAYGNHSMPSRPMSPKPCTPRPGTQLANLRLPGRTAAISMVSLESYNEVDSYSEAPVKPKTPKAQMGLLLSLQTLNQDDSEEEGRRSSQCHHGASAAPSLRDLHRSEVLEDNFEIRQAAAEGEWKAKLRLFWWPSPSKATDHS